MEQYTSDAAWDATALVSLPIRRLRRSLRYIRTQAQPDSSGQSPVACDGRRASDASSPIFMATSLPVLQSSRTVQSLLMGDGLRLRRAAVGLAAQSSPEFAISSRNEADSLSSSAEPSPGAILGLAFAFLLLLLLLVILWNA
ncbi:hypothetical protein AAMO2058_000348100 [Amorphochlora amoebiformis]